MESGMAVKYDEESSRTEKEGSWKNPLLPPGRKPYMVTNCPWQHAMWQRMEMRNLCAQYKPHIDANSHWAIDAHEIPPHTHQKKVSTSEALRGYSHHPHIAGKGMKQLEKQKGRQREEKQKILGAYTKNLSHRPKPKTGLTQGKHKVSTQWVLSTSINNSPEE